MEMEEAVTLTEAAWLLGIKRRTVYDWYQKGRFPNAYHLDPGVPNSQLRIPMRDVEAIFEARRQEGKRR